MSHAQDIAHATRHLSLLYVEDDLSISLAIQSILQRIFARVDLAHNGKQGLDLFKERPYDIVVSDIRMPEMDGITLCRHIKAANPQQSIIITSASNDSDYLLSLIELGIDKFILKPITTTKLYEMIGSIASAINNRMLLQEYQEQLVSINHYHVSEQQKGLLKQQSIIANDLQGDPHFLTKILYQPSDIMGGDHYSIYRKEDGSILLFILDAQGHGISPSLTAFAVAAAIRGVIRHNPYLSELSTTLLSVANSTLLEGEQLSCLFVELNPDLSLLSYFSCGMYPLWIEDAHGSHSLKANNPPVMNFDTQLSIDTRPLLDLRKLLLYSDGVWDSGLLSNTPQEYEALLDPTTLKTILNTLSHNTLKDDVTLLYLERI